MIIALLALLSLAQPVSNINEELFAASRAGDVARVTRALEQGADVNAKARYNATALTFAADRGHIDVVKLLLDRGADPNLLDTFYQMRAIDLAMMNNHSAVALLLLERGSKGAAGVLNVAIQRGDVALVKAALGSPELTNAHITSAMNAAKRANNATITELVATKAATMPKDTTPTVTVEHAVLESYVGSYRNEAGTVTLAVTLSGNNLVVAPPGQPPLTLMPTSQSNFRPVEFEGMTVSFTARGGMTERLVVAQGNTTQTFERVAATASSTVTASPPLPPPVLTTKADPVKPAPRGPAKPWPGFRGENATGNGDAQGAVTTWDVDTGENIRWKTPIPGIATASPIVSGNRVFVTTAISSAGDKTFRVGAYGDVAPVNDLSEHTWKIYALDKSTGKILWEQTAFTGLPQTKRHTKSAQANSTPVTDGKRVVAVFGSIGMLAAWDVNGKPLWTKDIGVIDSGWFFDPGYQWGHSSSPLIYGNSVIVQADQQQRSFIAAYDLNTGKEVWRTGREDEISTWGTPTLFRANGRDQVVTNGTKVRGYDPATGKLLWTLGPNSEITVGTPVVGEGLVYVTGGYPPVRPLYAVTPAASGDISLAKGSTSSDVIAWSNTEGTYIPTPLFYQGLLYTFNNNGVLTAYDARTGERVQRARVGGGGSFAASPIAADGRLFFANEDGDVFVARAGRTYEEVAKNEMKEVIMATPAISDGVIIIRTLGHVYAIGQK